LDKRELGDGVVGDARAVARQMPQPSR
jgi:hypothetical protein